MALLPCDCVAGQPPFDRLTAIYCALTTDVFDPDALAFFERTGPLVVPGAYTEAQARVAVNALVVGLKNADLWDSMTALYPFVGGNATAHAQNLKSASYTITWNGTLTHNGLGVTGNGVNGYGDTNLPRIDLPVVLIHLSCYDITNIAPIYHISIGIDDFGGSNSEFTQLFRGAAGAASEFRNNSTGSTASLGNSAGMLIGSRSLTSDQILDSAQITYTSNVSPAPAANIAGNLFVLGLNRNGTPILFSEDTMALISAGDSLTITEALAYRTIVNDYQAALGRAV